MSSFGNYSRHKCWKEIIRIQNTIHQCTPDWDSSSLPASFFSRLANSRPEPPAACQTAAPTDKALWSPSLHKLSQDTVGCPLFSGFMPCLRNSFTEAKQLCTNPQPHYPLLWNHRFGPLAENQKEILWLCAVVSSPSRAHRRWKHTSANIRQYLNVS